MLGGLTAKCIASIATLSSSEIIIKKDSEIIKAKFERKFVASKAKKESSDEECLTSSSEDEEYAIAVRDFKKFFKRRGSESDSGKDDDEKVKDKTCLIAHASSEICLGVTLEHDE
nr:transposase, Ptta/En/Spm, transposase, Tnp1/En/Spm-like protein [Tanacetum cinerariifolium]